MSSILDALKKVEDEKKARQAAQCAKGDSFQPEAAAAELVGDTPADGAAAIRISRKALVIGVVVLVAVVLGGTVGIMSMLLRSGDAVSPSASAATPNNLVVAQLPATSTPEPISPAAQINNDATRQPSAQEVSNTPPARQPVSSERVTPEEIPTQPLADSGIPSTTPEPKVSLPKDDTKPLQVAAVALTLTPTLTPRVDTPKTPPASSVSQKSTAIPHRAKPVIPEDIRKLPPLRSSERARFGLEGLKINMLREPGPNRPRGSAIINLKKVYLDDLIPGTTARLVFIAAHGIAIQVGSERELYFVAN